MYSANHSFSQMSSHHCIVTRSPNHWCAISCATVVARWMRTPRVTRELKTSGSRKVTQPGFSTAPHRNHMLPIKCSQPPCRNMDVNKDHGCRLTGTTP